MNAPAPRAEQPRAALANQPSVETDQPSRWGPLARFSHLWALLAYTILTVLLTWPIPARLATEVPGGGDAWQHIWNLWWVKEALLNLHTNPYHTTLLYYPDGVNLYFHTLVPTAGLTGIPLQLLGFNLIATYNLILLSTFVLAGYGTFLLCDYLTRNKWASFVGGVVFAFSPYHFAHLFGHMNLASLQWMPFYVLVLLKAMDAATLDGRRPVAGDFGVRGKGSGVRLDDRPSSVVRRLATRGRLLAMAAGVLLALNAYTDWLYAIFLALFTGVFVLWKAFVPGERRALAAEGVGWVEGGVRLALLGATFLAITSPIFFPTLQEAGKGYAQQPPEETLFYSADAVSAFVPSELHPLWGGAIKQRLDTLPPYLPLKNPSERTLFVGFSVLLLAVVGLWRWRRSLEVRFWAVTAALMWLLSLGPVLQVLGRRDFTSFGINVPLPYLLLYKLPLFSIMRTPARLTVLVMLALAVLAAFAVAGLLRWRGRAGLAVALVAPAVILFEFLAVPFPTVPPGWNVPLYADIAKESGQFALLELPLRQGGDYMAYQTIHGKAIIGGYLSRQPPYPLVERSATVRYFLDTTPPDDPLRAQVANGVGERELRDMGVRYVILHWWAFTPEQRAAMQAKLDALLNRPPDIDDPAHQVSAWRLGP